MINEKQILLLKLKQFERCLESLIFYESHYIIFSDYPSKGFLKFLLNFDFGEEVEQVEDQLSTIEEYYIDNFTKEEK